VNDTPLPLIFKHFWLLFIVGTFANGAIWWSRGRKQMVENPSLEPGYRRLIRGWLIYANVPWVIMGAGILFGGVPSVVHYFNPRNGVFVIAFYVSVVAEWILCFYWLFFRAGAEDLIAHPGLLNLPTQRPIIVKAVFLLSVAGGIAAMAIMIFRNIGLPE
jgi:hypothetical protein